MTADAPGLAGLVASIPGPAGGGVDPLQLRAFGLAIAAVVVAPAIASAASPATGGTFGPAAAKGQGWRQT